MPEHSYAVAEGFSRGAVVAVVALVLAWLLFVVYELRNRQTARLPIALTALVAALFVLLAVLRPERVSSRGSRLGPRVVVLLDQSRRMRLPAESGERRDVAARAVKALSKAWEGARVSVRGFSDGALEPVPLSDDARARRSLGEESDLAAALEKVAAEPGERPAAVVVVSDGRLARPIAEADEATLGRSLGKLGVPVHTVRVAERPLADASVRKVASAGAAVAHQPLVLKVTVGCGGGLACASVPVGIRELRKGAPPQVLAQGVARAEAGEATVDLEIIVDRAGQRIIEVAVEAPDGDRVPENDRRVLALDVTRERVRLLHVAGRPTYDVRQLRLWLKANESVDLIGFFILRTLSDQPNVEDESNELSLIPFPVDELFTEHLPSFDAVVLQDIDAVEYKLDRYLDGLENYVMAGGGLIMVGGPSAFAGGRYQRTPLERVLPVELPQHGEPYDLRAVAPRATEAGRAAPLLRGVRELLGEELPEMEGSNTLGRARPGAVVLWEHPGRSVEQTPMPLLALGESGDGRTVALAVDGTHELAFSALAERTSGRAYGALWDGLFGWLMRDPRYELGRVSVVGACIVGEPTVFELVRPPGSPGDMELEIEPLGLEKGGVIVQKVSGSRVSIDAGKLGEGGYSARLRVGAAPPTRFDFACERGGIALEDSRPDAARLERIARATRGKSTTAANVTSLPEPEATLVTVERKTQPFLPSWAWALVAATALGAHWLVRRQSGLA
ncbi:MAG TPA: glutamine amidotransferase [Polyangiaceae bacterium]